MNLFNKKSFGALILLILALWFTQPANASLLETVADDEVLIFLEDVVKLDLSKYDAESLGTTMSYPPELDGLPQVTGKYLLQSQTSKLDVLYKFRNNALSWCLLRVIEGTPQFSIQLSKNTGEYTTDFLERYHAYTGDSELYTMKNMLDNVDATKNASNTVDTVKIEVTNTADYTSFDWKYTCNGADYPGMVVNLRDGSFYSFSDKRHLYSVGSAEVNISREGAIALSYLYVENLTWTADGVEVADFKIVDEATNPKLLTRCRNDPLVLYPYWYVLLYLDGLYLGNVRHIQVMLWADTGELIDCQPLTFGGGTSPETKGTETRSKPEQSLELQTKKDEKTGSLSYTPLVAIATAIIITIAIFIVHKKKT